MTAQFGITTLGAIFHNATNGRGFMGKGFV
jgi:hypothetical protein